MRRRKMRRDGVDAAPFDYRSVHRPDLALDHLHLLPERALEKLGGYFHTALEHGAVFDPLPNLRAGDLGGRRVFHEIVDRHRAAPPQPGIDILYADPDMRRTPASVLVPL